MRYMKPKVLGSVTAKSSIGFTMVGPISFTDDDMFELGGRWLAAQAKEPKQDPRLFTGTVDKFFDIARAHNFGCLTNKEMEEAING